MAEQGMVLGNGDPVMGLGAGGKAVFHGEGNAYQAFAASAGPAALGATGAKGDFLVGILVMPTTTSPGVVTVKDGSNPIVAFPGGATSVADLKPFFIPVGAFSSQAGGWSMTTGANLTAVAIGSFT